MNAIYGIATSIVRSRILIDAMDSCASHLYIEDDILHR